MTSAQHARWIRSGMQWRLARPLAALRDRLRAYGYTVYDMGDSGHLNHVPPEDHTPYSETGWPGTTPYGWVTAIDIMPPGAGLPSLQQLGARILADKQGGHPGAQWLKFMNWEPERNNGGPCFKDAFRPTHVRTNSTDRGHIHLSCRSDVTQSAAGDGYDPIALIRTATPTGGTVADQSAQNAEFAATAAVRGDATLSLNGGTYSTPNVLHAKLDRILAQLGVAQSDIDDIQARTGAAVLSDVQVAAIAAAVVAHPDNPLGDADQPAIVEAVKQALREGAGA